MLVLLPELLRFVLLEQQHQQCLPLALSVALLLLLLPVVTLLQMPLLLLPRGLLLQDPGIALMAAMSHW